MKKSSKKLLGLGTSLLIGSVGVIVGIGVLKINKLESIVKQNDISRSVQNDGFSLDANDSFTIGDKTLSGNTTSENEIYVSTPNITRPVPNGYVTVNRKNQLICVNQNNPNELLWFHNYTTYTRKNVIAIEYTPYNDTLIVLNSNNNKSVGSTTRIYVDKYENISSHKYGFEVSPNYSSVVLEYSYNGSSFREDAWALSPIYKRTNEDGDKAQVTKYIIYPKVHTQGNANSNLSVVLFEYSIINDTIQSKPIDYLSYREQKQIIMGMGSWIYSQQIHIVALVLRQNASGTKIQIDYLVNDKNVNSFTLKGTKVISSVSGNLLDQDFNILSEAAKSNISGAAFEYDSNLSQMKFTFALNIWKESSSGNSFRKNTKLITDSVFCNSKTFVNNGQPHVINLWNENWGGYFDNSLIAFSGIGNKLASPLVLEGIDNRLSVPSYSYNGRFITVIGNVTNLQDSQLIPSLETDSNYWRIYMQFVTVPTNRTNSLVYSGFNTNVSISNNNQLGINQGAFGIPVLEYNREGSNKPEEIFSLNLTQLKNGSNHGIVINQKDRGSSTKNVISYGYYTNPSNLQKVWDKFGDVSLDVSSVDKNYLYNKLKIGNVPWSNSTFIKDDLQIKNARFDSKFIIRENTMNYNYDDGSVTFDLYSNIVYTNVGKLVYKTIGAVESEWLEVNKIGTFTFKGFKPTKATAISNFKIDPKLSYGGIIAPYLVPSEVVTNKYDSNTVSDFLNLVWQSICDGNVFFNLRKNPVYNETTWEDDFKDFFPNFDIKNSNSKFDNEKGIVVLNVKVSKKYAIPSSSSGNNDLVSFNDWKISGLRIVGATEFINNNSNSAFINKEWNNKNIPYDNTILGTARDFDWPSYVAPDVDKITVDEIKEFLFNEYINPAYNAANKENQYETSTNWVKNVAYKRNYGWQSDGDFKFKLTKEDIVISGFQYYPNEGKMKLDVRLDVWNKNDEYLHWSSEATVDGIKGTENILLSPKGTWWIGGFRTNNVTTFVDTSSVWELSELNNVPISDFENQKYRDVVNTAIVKQGIEKKYLKFPYWVNVDKLLNDNKENNYNDLISYKKLEILDVSEGIARIGIKFKSNYWYANSDGTIAEAPSTNSYEQIVTIKGFRVASPITIDSSQFFNFSSELLTSPIYLDPSQKLDNFVNWLVNIENKIIDYVVEKDKNVNHDNSLSKEDWHSRLKFRYSINDTSDEEFTFTSADVISAINSKLANKEGKLWFMYSNSSVDGFKLWVKMIDSDKDSPYTLVDQTTDSNKGFNFRGLLDTKNIILQLNMHEWIENLNTYRGTTALGLNQQSSMIESIKPPLLSTNSTYGSNLEFSKIESFLKTIGYKFSFSWKDSEKHTQNSDSLPMNFSYDSENPIINVTISYKDENIIPRVYIFDDVSHSTNSVSIVLSLAVKKTLRINYSFFKSMYKYLIIDESKKNIVINPLGEGDSSTISAIKTSWSNFEERYWELNNNTNKDEYKEKLKIVYSINDSDFNFDWNSMWDEINKNWIEAVDNITKIGKLRFYSPMFNNYGTKIEVKIKFRDELDFNDEYAIEYEEGISHVVVNHKLSTTFDMNEYSKFWSTTKSKANEGSTFDRLKGFTPATYKGVKFEQFEQETNQQLGLLIQYSNDGMRWFDSRESITSVNQFNPIVHMRFSSKTNDYADWGNNFEIKNFSKGTTNTVSDNEQLKWSNGVELHLNLPKYLQVRQEWINEFIVSKPLSGNTKYLNIDAKLENDLIKKIVMDNKPSQFQDPTPEVWLEYRLGKTGAWSKREKFIETLKQSTHDSTTNLIQFKVNVNPIDDNNPIYAVKENEYNLHDQNVKIFINTSYENEANNVLVSGTNDDFTYEYNKLPVNINGNWIGAEGLTIQWTTDKSATYRDATNDNKWQNTQINLIDSVERYLAIRIIAKDGYVYGANYIENNHNPTPQASIHVVNVEKIKSKIEVDLTYLAELSLSGYVHNLDVEQLIKYEKQILSNIKGGGNLKVCYQVILADENKLNSDWIEASNLQSLLNQYSTNYKNESQGLIKFKVNRTTSISTATIKATFISTNNQFIPIDKNGIDLSKGIETNTDNVKTKVDLSNWYKVLKTKPTSFKVGSTSADIRDITPPGMDGDLGSEFLAGMKYKQIVKLLETIGFIVEFKAPGSSTEDNWVSLDKINSLNNANELYIRFKVIDEFANSIEVWTDNNSVQDNSNPNAIKLVINLPITLKVSIEELKKLKFIGNTAKLENFDNLIKLEKQIIDNIIKNSQTNDQDTNNKINNVKLTIKYFLKGNPIENNWMTLEQVREYLDTSKENFTSNEVKVKVFILNNPSIDEFDTKQFQLSSDEEVVTQEEQFSDEVQFKVYIYQTDPTNPDWIFINKYLEGSEKKYTINDLDSWKEDINALKGLELEFNSVSNNGKPADGEWSYKYDKNYINKDKDYWIRFKVKPGFVFEKALKDDSKHSEPIKLDASRIKVTISLQSNWLEKLVLSGNTKILNIDENKVKDLINSNLPNVVNKDKLIKIQYTIDGHEWLAKDDFINKLIKLDGGLSETKWIILREDIKARFVIDNDINNQFKPPYGLEIDNIVINDESNKSPIVQLINDNKNININVKGYINANKLTPFIAPNFFVTGTNTKAFLITKEVAKFNRMLDIYKSTQIFDILYSSKPGEFGVKNKVWDSEGSGIVEKLALSGDFADKYIAINLKANSNKYDVYHDNKKQLNGYIISSPAIKVSLSIEIINPLNGKDVYITYINDDKQAIFYQNKGSFLFKIKKSDGNLIDFDTFINELPTGNDTESGQYTEEMKKAMELAYYVSDHELTSKEYNEVIKPSNIQKTSSISSEKYGVWKSAPTLNSSTNLNLSVNDYIIVALRIKPEFLSDPSRDDSGFVIKDNKHTPTLQSRAYGYKVKTSEIQVNWDSMEIKNVEAPVNIDKGLDGFAVLNKLSLVEDADKNYQGVSLKLNYFNDFYRDVNGNVLVSNAGDRLVKRVKVGDGIYKGKKPYYGADGQPIRDDENEEIYPYYDSKNRPSKPIKQPNSTRNLNLSEKEDNVFSFYNKDGNIEGINNNLIEYSLFANQYIQIEFMNKKGLSTEKDVYDYYVDKTNVTREYNLPTSLIKFLVSNVNNIRYEFNSTEFKQTIADPNPSNVFVNNKDESKLPKNGESKIKDNIMYKVTKTETNQSNVELTTLDQIKKQIETDFSGQVKLQTSIRRKGSPWEFAIDYGRIQNYTNLQNGDFIKVEIVPTDDDFVYAQQPEPLTFQITTLTIEDAPINLFQWLRVEQVGDWDGEGSFRIYVDDPNNPNDDNLTIEDLSNGKYYFEVQVWGGIDPATNERIIKHKWTRDIDTINDLKNGDKVAWQLRSPEGTVSSAYFNTVADIANHNSSENKYSFVQINKKGLINITPPVPQPENGPIGPKPENEDAYPETSGFEIANLRIRDQDQEFTSISYSTFADLMKEMNFSYQGVNGNGNMISSKDPRNVIVDIEKPSSQFRAKRATTFTLQYLIDKGYLSFAYNTVGLSDFNRFSWNQVKDSSGNYLVAPGLLSNGDKVKAIYKDPTMSTAYEVQLNDVWGLSKKTDSMPMFAWVGIGIASVATLGIFAFIYFFARNRKLKG